MVKRTELRKHLENGLKNKTIAADRIWHERRVGFDFQEMPAINIIWANSETDRDDRWEYSRFTIAGVIIQKEYDCGDGGFGLVSQLDEFDAEIKNCLNCIKIPGCNRLKIVNTNLDFNAEGQSMFASCWTSVEIQSELPQPWGINQF